MTGRATPGGQWWVRQIAIEQEQKHTGYMQDPEASITELMADVHRLRMTLGLLAFTIPVVEKAGDDGWEHVTWLRTTAAKAAGWDDEVETQPPPGFQPPSPKLRMLR